MNKALYSRKGAECAGPEEERVAFLRDTLRPGDQVRVIYSQKAGVTRSLSRDWSTIVAVHRKRFVVNDAGRERSVPFWCVTRVRRVLPQLPVRRLPRSDLDFAVQLPLFGSG